MKLIIWMKTKLIFKKKIFKHPFTNMINHIKYQIKMCRQMDLKVLKEYLKCQFKYHFKILINKKKILNIKNRLSIESVFLCYSRLLFNYHDRFDKHIFLSIYFYKTKFIFYEHN